MKTLNLKSLLALLLFFAFMVSLNTGCKKKDEDKEEKGALNMSICDARNPHSEAKDGIIESSDLTKCEITISKIQVKDAAGDYLDVLTTPATIDLRDFTASVSDLVAIEIPVGSYTAVKVFISGISTTYEGNNYTSSTTAPATATLAALPGTTFTEAQGVVDAFPAGEIACEMPLSFTLADQDDLESIRLFFDADASTYVVSYTYSTYTFNFAAIRELPMFGIILEEGIQQIRHSPPMGITIAGSDVNYYGIHTFIDFNGKGGTINSHTSQHVFRGEDGTLLVNAEDMAVNTNPLTPNTVAATGESDIRSDETFRYSQIVSNLATAGYTLESGKTYYFSLRKTWNITTDGQTYDLTRICEPIPVTIP